jgi:hypothetical protein
MAVAMTVNWRPSQHVPQVDYLLQYRPKGATVWINAGSPVTGKTSLVVPGLVADTAYEFRCIASVAAWSETSGLTELHTGIPPNAPTGLKVTS